MFKVFIPGLFFPEVYIARTINIRFQVYGWCGRLFMSENLYSLQQREFFCGHFFSLIVYIKHKKVAPHSNISIGSCLCLQIYTDLGKEKFLCGHIFSQSLWYIQFKCIIMIYIKYKKVRLHRYVVGIFYVCQYIYLPWQEENFCVVKSSHVQYMK